MAQYLGLKAGIGSVTQAEDSPEKDATPDLA
jgi:hypothetical protein